MGYPATADSEWKTLIVSPPSRALTFTADRTHVGAGNALVLTWTSADAQDWTLTFEGTPVPGFVPSEAGTLTVTPQSGGTFAFSALNAAGDAHSLELPITVGAPIIKSLKFAVSVVGVGESVSLSWSTLGAETLTLERPDAQATPETLRDLVDATDRAKITADTLSETAVGEETVYTLTLTNNSGSVSREITVLSTPQVAISSLTAGPSSGTSTSDPLELSEGTSIRLDWTAVNADALVLTELRPGQAARGVHPRHPRELAPRGVEVPPAPRGDPDQLGHRDGHLRAEGQQGGGSRLAYVSVKVVAKPTITASSTAPSAAKAATRGTPVLIDYTSNYAVRVRLRQGTTVIEESTSPSGAFAVSPQTTTTYILEAYNRLGLISSTVTVPATSGPPAGRAGLAACPGARCGAADRQLDHGRTPIRWTSPAMRSCCPTPSRTSAPWGSPRTCSRDARPAAPASMRPGRPSASRLRSPTSARSSATSRCPPTDGSVYRKA